MVPSTVTFDVTEAVPIDGRHHVSTWVFPPVDPSARVPVLCCLPGGSYTKAYWHLEVPGRVGYSFAEHMAARGMLVVAVDHLGTGESSHPPRAVDLTPSVVAGANAAVVREALEAYLADPGERGNRPKSRRPRDPLFADQAVSARPAPRDLASAHDDYLYGQDEP